MEKLEGYVDHIIYRNAENGYTVMVMLADQEEVTCVGVLSYIGEGEKLEAEGQYIAHPTYGEQFKIETYAVKSDRQGSSHCRSMKNGIC